MSSLESTLAAPFSTKANASHSTSSGISRFSFGGRRQAGREGSGKRTDGIIMVNTMFLRRVERVLGGIESGKGEEKIYKGVLGGDREGKRGVRGNVRKIIQLGI